MAQTDGTTEGRINQAFMMATARQPTAEELAVLIRRFDNSLSAFQADPTAASELVHVGEFAVDETLNVQQMAAFTTVTSLILNLDEVVNQP